MNYKLFRSTLVFIAFGVLSACGDTLNTGSSYEAGPVGTGPTVQELKKSPCACTEIPMSFPVDFGYSPESSETSYGL
jgi:hypothetical protein